MIITRETATKDLILVREKYGFTYDYLAKKTKVSRPTLIGIEKGRVSPGAVTIYKINNFLKTL